MLPGSILADKDIKSSPKHTISPIKKSVNGYDSIPSKKEETSPSRVSDSTLKCVDDPSFAFDANQTSESNKLDDTVTIGDTKTNSTDINSKTESIPISDSSLSRGQQPLGHDIMDSARNRFEQFWVKSTSDVEKEK